MRAQELGLPKAKPGAKPKRGRISARVSSASRVRYASSQPLQDDCLAGGLGLLASLPAQAPGAEEQASPYPPTAPAVLEKRSTSAEFWT